MSGIGRKLLRGFLPLLALGAGVGVLALLTATRPEPTKKPREERGALVEVAKVVALRERVRVVEQGSVLPAEQVVLQPEVSGRISWQHPELIPGGRFKKGEVLIRVDARDYSLAVRQQSAGVNKAELDVRLEKARKEIAKQEWEIIGEDPNSTEEGKALALRQPQLDAAKANLEAAKSAQAQAKLAVSKTVLRAPFTGFVKSESVDVGQLVTPQTPLATLVGSERFWVQVSVPVDKLSAIDIPGTNAPEGKGALATVVQEVGRERIERSGRVVRLLGDLDPVGRMARVLVEVEDPLGLSSATPAPAEGAPRSSTMPMLLGAYVEVAIEAKEMADVVELPRLALRDGDSVYVVTKDGRLAIKEVKVAWRRADTVLVQKGLSAGEEVVVSRLPSAVPGMLLRKAPPSGKTVVGQR